MNKKMSSIDRLKLWYILNKNTILISLLFVVFFFAVIAFSNFGEEQEATFSYDLNKFTESAEIISAEYEKIYGYARLDSTIPPVKGIKVKYTYEVKGQIIAGQQTLYKKGFKEIMKGLNDMNGSLEVRYDARNPEESIVFIKSLVLE